MNLINMIDNLEASIPDPMTGLPDDMFLFVSRITPMINVDLLIKNEYDHTLLTWRDDGYYPPGWHVPGGIIRYKEAFADRIRAVARNELGTEVDFNPAPLAINEVIHGQRKNRGHFISLLYRCRLVSPLDEILKCHFHSPKPGEWKWHNGCPDNILKVHEMYKGFM